MGNFNSYPTSIESEQRSQLHGLDHLRALAVTLVFFCHYSLNIFGHPRWVSHARFGWTGVDLFFVLSGFLISSQLFAAIRAGRGVNYKVFFVKRFFRIVPAFVAVTALYYLVPFFAEEAGLPSLSRLLTFTHNLGLDVHRYGAFSHSWSLCVEEHFYVALPLAVIVLHRFKVLQVGPLLIVALFLAGFTIREYAWVHYCLPQADEAARVSTWFRQIYYPTYTRLDGLLTGVSIAAVYTFTPNLWQRLSKYGNWFIALGIAVLAFASTRYSDPTYVTGAFGFPVISLAYGALVIGAVSPSSILHRWRSKVTALIATLSYGIYLLHKGVIHTTQYVAGNNGLNTSGVSMMVLCMGACVVVALALHHAVERPFMNMRDRILKANTSQKSDQLVDSKSDESETPPNPAV